MSGSGRVIHSNSHLGRTQESKGKLLGSNSLLDKVFDISNFFQESFKFGSPGRNLQFSSASGTSTMGGPVQYLVIRTNHIYVVLSTRIYYFHRPNCFPYP